MESGWSVEQGRNVYQLSLTFINSRTNQILIVRFSLVLYIAGHYCTVLVYQNDILMSHGRGRPCSNFDGWVTSDPLLFGVKYMHMWMYSTAGAIMF